MSRQLIAKTKNFGPVTSKEFEAMGLRYLDEIEALGFEDTCRRWVEYFPERLNANAFLGIACALDGTVWTKASPSHRRAAHQMVALLRKEMGLPSRRRGNRR